MAKRLLFPIILNSNPVAVRPTGIRSSCIREIHAGANEMQVKEIQIPVPWGHVSGKLWGNENEQPILAMHGWQDNAGTWDPLAPTLSKHRPILAIDFPGHGLSSWIPPGMEYFSWDFTRLILYIKEYFKWNKVSIMAHSMGSITGFRFASVFPDEVDFYIAIDTFIFGDYGLDRIMKSFPKRLQKTLVFQSRLGTEPPSYPPEELGRIWHESSYKSVNLDSVHHLLKRATKESKLYPGKYYFSRDPRLKTSLFNPEDKTFVESLVRRHKCPTLYVKAIDSSFGIDTFSVNMRKLIESTNEQFESHFVPGTHHVHLNNPERVEPLIMNFLLKYGYLKNNVKNKL